MIESIPMNLRHLMQHMLVENMGALSRREREKVVCFSAIFLNSPFLAKLTAGVLATNYGMSIDDVCSRMNAAMAVIDKAATPDTLAASKNKIKDFLSERDIRLFAATIPTLLDRYTLTDLDGIETLAPKDYNQIIILTAITVAMSCLFSTTDFGDEEYARAGKHIAVWGYI